LAAPVLGKLALAFGSVAPALLTVVGGLGTLAAIATSVTGPISALTGATTALAGVFGISTVAAGALVAAAGALAVGIGALAVVFHDELIGVTQDFVEFSQNEIVPALAGLANLLNETVGETLRDIAGLVEDTVIDRFVSFAETIQRELSPTIDSVILTLQSFFDAVIAVSNILANTLVPAIGASGNTLGNVLEPAIGPVVRVLSGLVNLIERNVIGVFRRFTSAVESLAALLRGDFQTAADKAVEVADSVVRNIKKNIGGLIDFIASAGADVVSAFVGLFPRSILELDPVGPDLISIGSSAIGRLIDGFFDVSSAIVGLFPTALNQLGNVSSALRRIGTSAIDAIISGFFNLGNAILKLIPTSLSDILGGGGGGDSGSGEFSGNRLVNIGVSIIAEIISGFFDLGGNIAALLPTSLSQLGADVVSGLQALGREVGEKIAEGILDAKGIVETAIESLLTGGDFGLGDLSEEQKEKLRGLTDDDSDSGGSGSSGNPDSDGFLPGDGQGGGGDSGGGRPPVAVNSGGLIESTGRAVVHEGERVVPEAQVTDRGGLDMEPLIEEVTQLRQDVNNLELSIDQKTVAEANEAATERFLSRRRR
jgi:hypothetical protein